MAQAEAGINIFYIGATNGDTTAVTSTGADGNLSIVVYSNFYYSTLDEPV